MNNTARRENRGYFLAAPGLQGNHISIHGIFVAQDPYRVFFQIAAGRTGQPSPLQGKTAVVAWTDQQVQVLPEGHLATEMGTGTGNSPRPSPGADKQDKLFRDMKAAWVQLIGNSDVTWTSRQGKRYKTDKRREQGCNAKQDKPLPRQAKRPPALRTGWRLTALSLCHWRAFP